jgi:hypothetical protein
LIIILIRHQRLLTTPVSGRLDHFIVLHLHQLSFKASSPLAAVVVLPENLLIVTNSFVVFGEVEFSL